MMNASNVLRLLRPKACEAETTQPPAIGRLDDEYLRVVLHALERLGVPTQLVEVEIVSFGNAPDGRQTYGALLKLVHWDRAAVVRLLLGPALLETRIRKRLADSWLPEVSLFAGLWVRLSTRLSTGPAGAELKAIIAQINAACCNDGIDLSVASRTGSLPLGAQRTAQ